MKQHSYDLAIRALISKDDGIFAAHALELDLVAEGTTEEEALKGLSEAICAQLSFAAQMENPDLINHPAPAEYSLRWDKAARLALAGIIGPEKAANIKTKAVCITIKEEQQAAIRSKKGEAFQRIPESAFASS
jgi:predicted RNase H-like HicB family nuclease